jgi:hypothetical protein
MPPTKPKLVIATAALRDLAQEWRTRARRMERMGFYATAATWKAGARELDEMIKGKGK